MTTMNLSNAAAKAAMDAITALGNVGGVGKLRIYSGTVPTDTDTALSGNTVLADFALGADDFGDATDSNPGATSTASAIADVNASASGTATFGRFLNNAGVAICQFDVGTASATCIVSSTTFVSGQPCSVTSFTLKHNE